MIKEEKNNQSIRAFSIALIKNKWALISIIWLFIIIIIAIFASELAPFDPNKNNIMERVAPPLTLDKQGNMKYFIGSDALGRDSFSRLIFGAQVSLIVGFSAVLVGGILGTALGVYAGFYGKWIDDIIMRLADIQLAFPFILLAILFLVVLGEGLINLIIVLGIGQWVTYARIARAQTISQKEKEYVEAAKALGVSNFSIMFGSILPNIFAPLIVIASFNVASVILAEAALSFLGLGVPPQIPTWGAMLAESRDHIFAKRWWMPFFPGMAILLTVLAFNIVGDWLRDYLDPRLKEVE
ncbi:ABC transporter permease [Pelagibacteraceae bacterium]|mgnify:FL=1|nr:ABC transporter permease [Pelagibacteraceae bacterium]|tara:strand:- start:230 stop:1120 length:891 start_codon:yes stop_codon:yes gene_type:complete